MKLLFLLSSVAFAATYECPLTETDLNTNLNTCKMHIIKDECEQRGIQVWSNTIVDGNSLQADEIKTNAECDNLGIHIDEIKLVDNKAVISYTSIESGNSVHEVSADQWGETGTVSHHVSGSYTKVKRDDSTSIVDFNVGTQVDSREIKRDLKKIEHKLKLIASILVEDN